MPTRVSRLQRGAFIPAKHEEIHWFQVSFNFE